MGFFNRQNECDCEWSGCRCFYPLQYLENVIANCNCSIDLGGDRRPCCYECLFRVKVRFRPALVQSQRLNSKNPNLYHSGACRADALFLCGN